MPEKTLVTICRLGAQKRGACALTSASVTVQVETEAFAGPFDLLLHLIVKDEVDLYEISLSDIVDAYMAELAKMEHTDLEVATEFLLIAATLVELKCRRLLPVSTDIDLDEEFSVWEERDLLLSRLLECKTFKDTARVFEHLAEGAALVRPRISGIEEQFIGLTPDLLEGVHPMHIHKAFLRAMRPPPPPPQVSLFHITQVKASVTDAIGDLLNRFESNSRVSFRDLTADLDDKLEIVVRFLAVLELFKQGLVEVDQPHMFGDMVVDWIGDHTSLQDALAGSDSYEG